MKKTQVNLQAIAIQWSKMFHKAHLHKKKSFRLGEGAVIETIGENSRRIILVSPPNFDQAKVRSGAASIARQGPLSFL